MGFSIKSGSGNGKSAEVDNSLRLRCRSIIEEELGHATELGYRYNINTGTITLTSANASAVFYFKNNEDYDFVIESFIYNIDDSTGGTAAVKMDVYVKNTGGTIISGASDTAINVNLNIGSPNTLVSLAYKGAEANTLTGGTYAISSLIQPGTRAAIPLGKLIIPKGGNVGVIATPPASNTSLPLQVAISGYIAHPDVLGGITS